MGKPSLWAKKPIKLIAAYERLNGKREDVEAWIVNKTNKQFAVHRALDSCQYEDTWAVTHIASGARLPFYSGSKRTAAQRTQQLWAIFPAAFKGKVKALKYRETMKVNTPIAGRKLILSWGGQLVKHNELPEGK